MVAVLASCKKDARVPPVVSFKTSAGYTSADVTVAPGTPVLVGFVADKTEDELKTFNVSYAYDGAATTTTAATVALDPTEEDHYENDYTINTRTTPGTEKWIFTVTDRDGNVSQKDILLTVQ